MIRLQLIDRADIARAMALMAIERAAATPVVLIKRNDAETAALPAGMKSRSPQTTNTERKLADLELAVTEGLKRRAKPIARSAGSGLALAAGGAHPDKRISAPGLCGVSTSCRILVRCRSWPNG